MLFHNIQSTHMLKIRKFHALNPLTLSYTAIVGIASFTAVAENGHCKNTGI